MRILWLDDDRSMRVCDFWTPLRVALEKIAEVETILRPLDMLEGAFCRACTLQGKKLPKVLDPARVNEFDWIISAAPWAYMLEDWDKITAKKAIFWGDCHGPMVRKFMAFAEEIGTDLFLPTYRDGCRKFQAHLPPGKVEWVPYWVAQSYLHDYGERKTVGFLQTGVIHPHVYPWRTRIFDAINGRPWYLQVDRPRERMDGNYWPVGEDYGRLINTAKIASACTSRFHYPVSKLFEIPSCRCALLCDTIPEMADLGFVPWVNYLPLEEGMDILKMTMDWLSEQKAAELEAITDAGYRLMADRHTTDIRARELVEILGRH